VKELPIFQKGL